MSIGGSFWSSASAFARSLARSLARVSSFLYLGNPSFSRVSRRSRLRLLAGKVRATPQRCVLTSTTAVPVNTRNPITGLWTRNEIAFVAAHARLPTRFLRTMNRISSVFRHNSNSAGYNFDVNGLCDILLSDKFSQWISLLNRISLQKELILQRCVRDQ